MNPELLSPLREVLLSLADDQVILGHRNSEWCGHAPILEEDIAFANISLDEIGHANLLYTLLAGLGGSDDETDPDRLVFWRSAKDFRCLQIVELPRGDWAFSMLRQWFYDTAELVLWEGLESSQHLELADVAKKIRKEELYHHRHTSAWVRRLGLGNEDSHARMQKALQQLWPYTAQLFAPWPEEARLVEAGMLPAAASLKQSWLDQVLTYLHDCQLDPPPLPERVASRDQHTSHLAPLLAEMQSVARQDPEARW